MIHPQTTFRHHLFQIAIAERIPEIPPHTQHDHFILEMSSSECRWPVLSHSVYVTSLLRRLRHYRSVRMWIIGVTLSQSCEIALLIWRRVRAETNRFLHGFKGSLLSR